ncbi:retrotransposon protein, putative, Ty3-gypsy subclass [Panicum miliaceum]|uniref:Retrotransposon protein, putative, Ty3-gypsy subclass n=1 Tax=Panicum miliaceum TaxID=4540 RepID=A0A3L6RL63_PANMI|nr:retrotransposon protein, putative, Ty3-gypsy subclass [Panicum miliaceum]
MKLVYFLMALETTLLTWLENLKKNSINSWDDLKVVFIDNCQGAITRAGTHHDLSQCKQERNDLLRSYTHRFFDHRATIANISEQDVIDCFHNGLTDQALFRDFGHNHPKTVSSLRDMMQAWARRDNDYNNNKRSNDHRNDRSQWDYSGSSSKRKPNDLVTAVEHPPHGKKSGSMQEQFEKLLEKQCMWLRHTKHLAIKCYNLLRIFNAPPHNKNNKKKDKEKEDDEPGDKAKGSQF